MIRISVIIPVYRDSKGLQRTLDSLIQQTIPVTDFDVLVINDGNDSEIVKLEERYKNATLQVNFLHRHPNKGAYFSRNEGIQNATASNLAFIDAESIATSTWLEVGLRYLHDYDYVAGNIQIDLNTVCSVSTYCDYLTAFPIEAYFNEFGFGVTGNLFVKKAVFSQVGLFRDELYSGGDMEFGVRLNEFSDVKKIYAKDCIVLHPARGNREQVKKIRRVANGQKMLVRQMPEKFSFLKKTTVQKLKGILPPSPSTFNKIFKRHAKYRKLSLYLYMYRKRVQTFIANF